MSNTESHKELLYKLMYELLPAVYRARDKSSGSPSSDSLRGIGQTDPGALEEFLSIISEHGVLLDEDIRRLYDNHFIETCEEWALSYIGDLIGYQFVVPPIESAQLNTRRSEDRPAFQSVRREVANTIRYRRRKGSLALLESMARDITGWPARAVEFLPLILASPSVRYATVPEDAVHRGGFADIREAKALDLLRAVNGACNTTAHTVDIRRISSTQTPGHFHPSHIGLFVCRLQTYSVTDTPARSQEENGVPHCYTFSPLGNNTTLFSKPQDEVSPTQIAGMLNLPIPIRRQAFQVRSPEGEGVHANEEYYGKKKSLFIRVHKWKKSHGDYEVVADDIISADLNEWKYQPPEGRIAVDPELGRIAFHPQERPVDVWVSYHYGFPGDLGGGEYRRSQALYPSGLGNQTVRVKHYQVCSTPADRSPAETIYPSIQAALAKWKEDRSQKAFIEIEDSRVYEEPDLSTIRLDNNQELHIGAKTGCRPMLRILDSSTGRPESLHIEGGTGSRLELNGLLIAGRGLEVDTCLGELAIIHSTLVPGWEVEEQADSREGMPSDTKTMRRGKPSLSLRAATVSVVISHSILGPIHMDATSPGQEVKLQIDNSIVDAIHADEPAICGCNAEDAGIVSLRNSTILGEVHAYIIESADNTIFMGHVQVKRQQAGCIRFCYVPPGSRTPRRYHCQPDLAIANLTEEEKISEAMRVRPIFTETRYGTPGYCQIGNEAAVEITTGAEDQAEMGVFHHLCHAPRVQTLQARLREYVPAGYESKLFFVN